MDVFGPVDFDWMRARSYYFYDPNGNLLEFRSPDPDQAHPHVSRTAGV